MEVDIARARLEAAYDAVRSNGLDFVLIGPSADMAYLLGRRLPSTERFNAVILARQGPPIVIVPHLQRPLVVDLPIESTVISWGEGDNPIGIAADIIRSARRIGFNAHFWACFLLPLQADMRHAEFVDASNVLGRLRLQKGADEICLLEDLAKRFDAIWSDFCSGCMIGLTEYEVALHIAQLGLDHGFHSLAWCDVGSGPNGASPLHHWSERRIQPGDPVVIDFAAERDGYFMDTCRTPIAGEPEPGFLDVYDTVNMAYDAAAAAVRPGASAAAIDAAARRVITEAGYGEFFLHRVGHGLGMDAHEEPYLASGSTAQLAPGMVFSNEPGIYIPGRWGVRIENIMTVTESGGRSLNYFSRSLIRMA